MENGLLYAPPSAAGAISGIFQKILFHFTSKLKKRCTTMIDSTYIKAYTPACNKASDKLPPKLGRTHGGITTKIHLLCNLDGMSLDFTITDRKCVVIVALDPVNYFSNLYNRKTHRVKGG